VTLRRMALALAAGGAALYLGVALPAASRLSATREELADLEHQRAARTARLARQQRREEALLRAGRSPETASLMGIRREIVGSVDRSRLTEATVDVKPGRAPAAAVVRVQARGAFAELMSLAQRLAEPGSGLVLDRVRLVHFPSSIVLEVEGQAVGALP